MNMVIVKLQTVYSCRVQRQREFGKVGMKTVFLETFLFEVVAQMQ